MSSERAATAVAYEFQPLDSPSPKASDDIADVVSDAWAEAEEIRERARAAGAADGRAEGLAAARAELEPALAALHDAARSLTQLRAELTAQLERDAAEIALLLSEQILAGALAVQPERVIDVARNALRHLTDRRHVTLVVNPADLEMLEDGVETLAAELGGIEHLAVQSDRRVTRGGAIARTDIGEIDATIGAQLSRAREVALEALSGPGADVT